MKKSSRHETKQVTMAELCEALTNGTIRAQIKNGEYVIRHHDLARLAYADALKMPVRDKKPVFSVVGVA